MTDSINFSAVLETLVRNLEALEKARDPSYGWPEAGLLVILRKAWANYDYDKAWAQFDYEKHAEQNDQRRKEHDQTTTPPNRT